MYTVHVYVYGYTYCLGFMHSSSSYIFIAITAIETLQFFCSKLKLPGAAEKGSPRALGVNMSRNGYGQGPYYGKGCLGE